MEIKTTELKEGMILEKPVYYGDNVQLLSADTKLSRKEIEFLLRRNIKSVIIREERDNVWIKTTPLPEPSLQKSSEFKYNRLVFKGDMKIDKNISDNAEVEIEGNLEVDGKIYAAKVLIKDGDLIVDGIEGKGSAQISVDGSLHTNYVMGANVSTKKDFTVNNIVSDSNVTAGGNVIVHSTDLNAMVFKSEIKSEGKVIIDNLGMKGETGTIVIRIKDREKRQLFEQILNFEKFLNESNIQAQHLKKIVDVVKIIGRNIRKLPEAKQKYLYQNTKQFLKIKQEIKQVEQLLKQNLHRIESLNKQKRYFVRVLNNIFPGVVIEIDEQQLVVKEKMKNIAFYKKGIIIMENMKKGS